MPAKNIISIHVEEPVTSEALAPGHSLLHLVKLHGRDILKSIDVERRSCIEEMEPIISLDGMAFEYVCGDLLLSKRLSMIAVNQNGCALQFVHQSHLEEIDITIAAVKNNGLALEHVSDMFKDNPTVVSFAVQQDLFAFNYAAPSLRRDITFIISLIKQVPNFLLVVDEDLKDNPRLIPLIAQYRVPHGSLTYKDVIY
ncbi:MAG: DUF4116 domain-containing protein [Pseudomonadota bacterium]|nr:DUF4116 domain-containing protein [Pseudomonadota bacterium]